MRSSRSLRGTAASTAARELQRADPTSTRGRPAPRGAPAAVSAVPREARGLQGVSGQGHGVHRASSWAALYTDPDRDTRRHLRRPSDGEGDEALAVPELREDTSVLTPLPRENLVPRSKRPDDRQRLLIKPPTLERG